MNLTIGAILLASIPTLVFATPISLDQYNNLWRFTPVASETSGTLNLRSINANDRHFWIGRETSTFCPLRGPRCPLGNNTILDVSGGGASLDVTVPGGQIIYTERSGALGFAQAHSITIPDGSLLGNFSVILGDYLGLFKFNDGGWLACPTGTNGTAFPYKIFAYLTNVTDPDIPRGRETSCTGLDILAMNYTESSPGAWEYI